MNPQLSSFAARLRGMISRESREGREAGEVKNSPSQPSRNLFESEFPKLALELFTLQFENNFAYKKICEVRKLTPETVKHWTQIPFVPTSVFKELELTSLAPEERTAVFHSSGTTEQRPGRHFHCAESLALYEASLWSWFERNVSEACGFGREALGLTVLTPPPARAPHSSLVHMFEIIRQKFNAPENVFTGKISEGAWTLDFDATLVMLQSIISHQRPALLLGTAFSFVHLLDFLAEKQICLQLPSGSRVMETGGYKNRSRSMPKAELHALVEKFLGVPRRNIVCEYGMSELSSQAYSIQNPESKIQNFNFPPWARAQIISPETGREAADGETGIIRIFDLANVFSVAAIQTEDLGVRRGDGFELIGRAQSSEPRGCSLMTA